MFAKDAEGTGIKLERYVTDLDAKTAVAVRESSREAGITLPEQKYDPGHWKKGFGKDASGRAARIEYTSAPARPARIEYPPTQYLQMGGFYSMGKLRFPCCRSR